MATAPFSSASRVALAIEDRDRVPAQRQHAGGELADGAGADRPRSAAADRPAASSPSRRSPLMTTASGSASAACASVTVVGHLVHVARARHQVRGIRAVLADDADLPPVAAADRLVALALRTLAAALDALDDDAVAFVEAR